MLLEKLENKKVTNDRGERELKDLTANARQLSNLLNDKDYRTHNMIQRIYQPVGPDKFKMITELQLNPQGFSWDYPNKLMMNNAQMIDLDRFKDLYISLNQGGWIDIFLRTEKLDDDIVDDRIIEYHIILKPAK